MATLTANDAPARQTVGKAPGKALFDIDVVMARVAEAVKRYAPAALFALADEGYSSVFEQVVACLLSIRTLDETALVTARRLFARARTPEQVLALPLDELDSLIRTTSFHTAKAASIHEIARRAASHGSALPCDAEVLLSLKGVGPKCGHLALAIACGQPRIAVDIHVHRIVNRWGYVEARTPEETMAALERKLPERYWIDINRLLVPFGKWVCTGRLPHCSTCPVLEMCRQVGVTKRR